MDKLQLISLIESQISSGAVTREDLYPVIAGVQPPAIQVMPPQQAATSSSGHTNIINVFYVIGAIIVLVGVCILVAQYWTDIGFIGRFGVTLGIATVTYVAGFLFRAPGMAQRALSQTLFVISAALLPLGGYVVLSESGVVFGLTEQTIISIGGAVLFSVAFLVTRRNILYLLTIFYLTWTYWAVFFNLFEGLLYEGDILMWASIVLGVAYVLLGFAYRGAQEAADPGNTREVGSVRSALYALGTLSVLGGGIMLKGIWDFAYIAVLFGAFYLSVYLRTRVMLIFAGLFLTIHLILLTSEYFASSVGWPVALVVCGFVVIGVGYLTYFVNRRFLK